MSRFGAIRGVTHVVPGLDAAIAPYLALLDYRLVEQGEIDAALAASWDAPAMAGARFASLRPVSGEPTLLRFIEDPTCTVPPAFRTHGWNATEITVQDVDALAARLDGSAFRTIGAPAFLDGFPMVRAMQVLGPSGECLYLTHVGPGLPLDTAAARSFVGRVFICVVGGADRDALARFYGARGNDMTPWQEVRISVLANEYGMGDGSRFALSIVPLADGTLFELDEYPAQATARPAAPGHLPPGMAIVSVECDALGADAFLGPPAQTSRGRVGTLRGPAGELLELIERVA